MEILVIMAMYSYAMILDGNPVGNDRDYKPFTNSPTTNTVKVVDIQKESNETKK